MSMFCRDATLPLYSWLRLLLSLSSGQKFYVPVSIIPLNEYWESEGSNETLDGERKQGGEFSKRTKIQHQLY